MEVSETEARNSFSAQVIVVFPVNGKFFKNKELHKVNWSVRHRTTLSVGFRLRTTRVAREYLRLCPAAPYLESFDREAETVVETEDCGPQNFKNPTYQILDRVDEEPVH